MTVECALVLPLFFLALVMLITFMNAVGLQISTDLTLSNRARALSQASYTGELLTEESSDEESIWIDLHQSTAYDFPVSFLPLPALQLACRARVYPWIGERVTDSEETAEDADPMVYVTDNQSVYHTSASCTHLKLTVRAVAYSEIASLRNAYGSRYRPCDGYPDGYEGIVYVTEMGDCYYPTSTAAGLTRHVRMVRLSEVSGLPACSRCAAG